MHRYQCRQTPPPPPIDHRSLENHYTASVSCRQTPPPPPIDHRSMQDHCTDYVSQRDICTDTSADRPHPLLQLTIDLWKTTTLNMFHISKNAQISVQTDPTPPPIDHRSMEDHQTNYISHIDVCTDTSADRPHPSPPINHRSMEDHYTNYVSHTEECTDTSADRPHLLHQSTIHLWKTAKPTKFHI